MRKKVILITGANGEVGHGLIRALVQTGADLLVLDLRELEDSLRQHVKHTIVGDILDTDLMDRLATEYEIETIYHLAALLSTHSEFRPESAHRVNVQGTINLLQLAIDQASWRGQTVKFIFPSSVAAYGIADLATKQAADAVSESQFNSPITMYGCNKLYCEHLGRYYTQHYRQLAAQPEDHRVDFRSVRFPGLISALTVPSGGTSDYAPEMVHAAARGEAYECFVRPDTIMPFMVMPDAIRALLKLADAPRDHLTSTVYNVTSFSLTAEAIADLVRAQFPHAQIQYVPSPGRQKIVDSWPARLDDRAARQDWAWSPEYDARRAFEDYLFPTIRQQYGKRII